MKASYEAEKLIYNAALKTAEESTSKVTDHFFKLVFRERSNVFTFANVPVKPNNPSVPAAYAFYDESNVKTWGNIDGGWGHYTTTELAMSDIRTGRSFGVLGTGMNDGSVWATANYGKGVLYGATKN